MKAVLLLFFTTFSISHAIAQDGTCYSITIKNVSLCASSYKWKSVKIIAPRQKLLDFLRTSKVMHDCNYAFKSEDQITENFKPENCISDKVHIEMNDPKDVVQLYKEAKKQEPNASAQVCLSSDGTVSISFGVGDASFEVNSKGKFAFSAKGSDGIERKAEL